MLARKLMAGPSAGGLVATLGNGSAASYGTFTRIATVRIASDGNVYTGDNGFFTFDRAWRLTGGSSAFDVRCTVLTGSVSGTATASWLSLSTTRDWYVSDPTDDGNSVSASVLFEIRNASSLAVLASGNWELIAESFGGFY